MESIHDISEGFLAYDYRQDINTIQCSVYVMELYSNHISIHLNALKERLPEKYRKRYELEEMPTARVTRPQAIDTLYVPTKAQPSPSENFGERNRRLFNQRTSASALRNSTTMEVATRPSKREKPPQPDACIDVMLYIKLSMKL